MLRQIVKKWIRKAALNRGLDIGKYPTTSFTPVPVFALATQLLMVAKGPEFRFIQVGANDGKIGDAISGPAIDHGWRGILVEPQPDVFFRLKETYARVADRMIFENAAVTRSAGTISLYRAPRTGADSGFASTVASTDPRVASAQLGIPISQLETISVPCMTLDALIEKHRWTAPDLLFIDTEGHDCDVLLSLDLKAVSPTIVQFEHGHLSPSQIDSCVAYLSDHGYQVLYGGRQLDTIALHASRYWDAVREIHGPGGRR